MRLHKALFSTALLMMATTVSAQYLHLELNDGTKVDFDSKDVKSVVIDNEEPTVQGKVTVNGVTYTRTVGGTVGTPVDLGLKSGVLWADHNIGARKPEDFGVLLAWGEVGAEEEGYVDGVKYIIDTPYYSFNKYKHGEGRGEKSDNMTKYTTRGYLEPVDDAAYVNWGEDWRVPTSDEIRELVSNCKWEYTTIKVSEDQSVIGYKVTGTNGNSIFIPAAGWRGLSSDLKEPNKVGNYWQSYTSGYNSTTHLRFDDTSINPAYGSYYSRGLSIRPVYAKKNK